MDVLEIEDLIVSLSKLHKLFDVIRVIDPIKKQAIGYEPKGNIIYNSTCYDIWKKEEQCDNCVSARAAVENDTFVKIECKDNEIFMITASPVKLGHKRYIVEMLKNITNTGIITNLSGKSVKENNEIIKQLNRKIFLDDLTCLYNRRYINEKLPIEILKATTNKKRFSVIMLDIDWFKNTNDVYGHLAGDAVLQKLSRIMRANIRKDTDWIARYGGEEFLIFLKDAKQADAYQVGENIRKVLEKEVIEYENHAISVTISIGTYTVNPGTKDFKAVIKSVDKNLYRAKNGGRNRTISS